MTKLNKFILLFLSIGLVACNTNVKTEDKKETIIKPEFDSPNKLREIWKTLPLKNLPIIDSTNFENIKNIKEFNTEQLKSLQISDIYKGFYEKKIDLKLNQLIK